MAGTEINLNWTANSTSPLYDQSYQSGDRSPLGVVGPIIKGSTINIYDSGFGGGPTVDLYDGMEGVVSQTLNTTNPLIGAYESNSTAYFQSGGRDGGTCLRTIDGTGYPNGQHQFNSVFNSDVTEIFISYAYKHKAGTYWPSQYASTTDIFPDIQNNSSLKQAWLMYGDGGHNKYNDLVFMSHMSGGGIFGLVGNDQNVLEAVGGAAPPWFVFDNWIRETLWAKADKDNPDTANGEFYLQFMNGNDSEYVYGRTDMPVFDSDRQGSEPAAWDRVKFAQGAGGPAIGTVNHAMDDVYIAIGENAAARVELGNNATYGSCTELVICPSTVWTDTQITAAVEIGALNLGSDVWCHVTLADNSTRKTWKVL